MLFEAEAERPRRNRLALDQSGENRSVQRRRICEINFYLATFYLQRGAPEARTNLNDAVSNCSAGSIELAAVKAELHGFEAELRN